VFGFVAHFILLLKNVCPRPPEIYSDNGYLMDSPQSGGANPEQTKLVVLFCKPI